MDDIDNIIRRLTQTGWAVVTHTNKGHIKIIPVNPNQPIIITSGTSSDINTIRDLRSRLRRAGWRE